MPNNKVLYYPNFEPSKFWFRSHLLFYDSIKSIIPERYDHTVSAGISDIIELQPNCFSSLSPINSDKKLNDVNFDLFDSAFARIFNNPVKYPREFGMEILDSGKTRLSGDVVFLHNDKMSEQMAELLQKYEFNSLNEGLKQNGITFGDFSIVNRYAADLIVSHIADNMGKRLRLNTMTENSLAFTINSLNPLHFKKNKQKKDILTSTIVQCIIPENIEFLSPDQFLNIREDYSDIRVSLHKTTNELAELHNLSEIENSEDLHREINDISRDFIDQVNSLKKTVSPDLVKRFVSISFGTAGILLGNIFDEPIRTGSRIASVVLAPVISEKFALYEPESVHIQRRIGSLQKEIEWQSEMRQLLKSGWC